MDGIYYISLVSSGSILTMSTSERIIKDKSVVVTGAATGIGFEIAESFLRKGAKQVAILDINLTSGAEAAKKLNSKYGVGKATFIECDISNETDTDNAFKKLISEFKNVDVLVNNAGIVCETNWKKCVDVNLTYLIGLSLKYWNYMRKDKSGNGGTIINIASIYGFRVDQYIPVYQATKFGVYGFSKSLGHQYNYDRTGVRVVALCPGFTRTPLVEARDLLDDDLVAGFDEFQKTGAVWQTVDALGIAAVDLFENSDSGKAWLIEGGVPIVEV